MNLNEKEMWMRENAAYPSIDDYGFSGGDAETKRLLAGTVNKILATAFERAISGPEILASWHIMRLVYRPLNELQRRYYDIGLCTPRTYCTIARFWGLNYHPEIYDIMGFPPATLIHADPWL